MESNFTLVLEFTDGSHVPLTYEFRDVEAAHTAFDYHSQNLAGWPGLAAVKLFMGEKLLKTGVR